MHVHNNNGDSREFSVGETHGYATILCQIGRDVPFDWLQAMPLTLTISAPDRNPSNNTATLDAPPPDPGACVTSTPVASPTSLPTYTATRTCTPPPPPTGTPA